MNPSAIATHGLKDSLFTFRARTPFVRVGARACSVLSVWTIASVIVVIPAPSHSAISHPLFPPSLLFKNGNELSTHCFE